MASAYKGPEACFIQLEQVVSNIDGLELKGKTNPYCSVNGYMIVHLNTEGTIGVRLSDADREELILKYSTKLYEQNGRVMKEFVLVPETIQKDIGALEQLLRKSMIYALALKKK